MSELDASLRGEGQRVAEGQFRVDARRAMERLRTHRFADPAHWVLEVLRAAVASHATAVTVRTDADDVELAFDGDPFPAALMKDLPAQALNAGPSRDEKRTRLLALGVAGGLGLDPAWVRVASGGVALELAPPDVVRVSACPEQGTRVALHKRLGWRVAAALLRGAPEALAMRERARRFPAKLLLNGARVDSPAPFPGQAAELRQVKAGAAQVTAVTPAGAELASTWVDLDVLGVLVARRRLTLPGLQCLAWVRGDELRRNASGSDVVDDDPGLASALAALRGISFELLDARVAALQAEDDPPLRHHLLELLLQENLDPKARQLLERAPLLPGPAGEWLSPRELQESVAKGNPVRFATRLWPAETYERPAVLLLDDADPRWESLLPKGRRVDVGVAARARLTAAAARAEWQARPAEPVALPDRGFVATATVDTGLVRGEVGLLARGDGAFVKLLCEERFVQQGDVPALAPLRLHAVVNSVRPLRESVWQEGLPSPKLWSLVAQPVEAAVTRLILERVAEPAMLPHARDLLARCSRGALSDVPAALLEAPLFECLGGERVSLAALRAEKTWRYTTARWPWPLLSGARVLLLDVPLLALLRGFAPKKLQDASEQLLREREIRRRLEGPREAATVRRAFAAVPVQAEGIQGEVGVPAGTAARLELTLLRDGFALETTEFHARYGVAVAVVECAALRPNAGWTGALRDEVFARVQAAVAEAEARLPLAVVAKGTSFADLGAGPRRLLRTFFEKELAGFDPQKLTEVQRAVAAAPLFASPRGRLSLLEVRRLALEQQHLWVAAEAPRGLSEAIAASVAVVIDDGRSAELLSGALGLPAEDFAPERRRLEAVEWFLQRPKEDVPAPAGPFAASAVVGALKCAVALAPGVVAGADVTVRLWGRVLSRGRFGARLPLVALIDSDALDPGAEAVALEAKTREVLRAAEQRVLELAVARLRSAAGPLEGQAEGAGGHQQSSVASGGSAREGAGGSRHRTGASDAGSLPASDSGLLEGQGEGAGASDGRSLPKRRLPAGGAAPGEPSLADARRALLVALGRGVEDDLPEPWLSALRAAPLFPCTDGLLRSAQDLAGDGPLRVVRAPLPAQASPKRPVVVATDAAVAAGVKRWAGVDDVTASLHAELEVRLARERVPAVERVTFSRAARWRTRLEPVDLDGEVVVAAEGGGRLELYVGKRPLCALPAELPPPLGAAVNCDALTLAGRAGVERDAVFRRVLKAVDRAGEVLACDDAAVLAAAQPPLGEVLRADLVRLAFWLVRRERKQKKGTRAKVELHALYALPLLEATDERSLSVGQLLEAAKAGPVPSSHQRGRLLDPEAWVWLPRLGEEEAAAEAGLALRDASEELNRAASIRSRPRVDTLRVPIPSGWREPVAGPGVEGEVALPPEPGGALRIDVLKDRVRVEAWSSKHPVGGEARVSGARIGPNAQWTEVARNQAFKELVSCTEAALERLLVRRLTEGPRDDAWRAWARAAVRWKAGKAGALGALVPKLELFAGLDGRPVTVGAVLAEHSRARSVAVATARRARAAPPSLVLADSSETSALLETLKVKTEDVTQHLERTQALSEARRERRLLQLAWPGEALVRLKVATATLSGELALVAADGELPAELVLAREGVRVEALKDVPPGVAGALDVKDLAVNEDWTAASLTAAQRAELRAQVDALHAALVAAGAGLSAAERAGAVHHVLAYLGYAGVSHPADLDRQTGVGAALQNLPVFRTLDGRWLGLRAVATEALSRGKVAVMESRLFTPDLEGALVLETPALDAPWIALLEAVLGKGRVSRVKDLSAWREARAEEDPREGTPEAQGLRLLRREARLLRAGALGKLTPDELEEIRLRRGNGKVAVQYDARRRLVLLDPAHPAIARTLANAAARPERIWVLLATIFGVINRALERVTDEHEAQLLLALAGHLASNPKSLEPRAPREG